ncbi:VanZ family protein [Christensenellaceae bacterium OttesenSCG-928-L17]|nr:VanZ family protein [Christensenellaceae bacterium OttesenSCG-928-L17]
MFICYVCIIPLAIVQLIRLPKARRLGTTGVHELGLLLFSFSVIAILSITGITPLSGVHLNIVPEQVNLTIGSSIESMRAASSGTFVRNVVGNVLLFMPLGFLLPLLWKRNGLFSTVVQGALFSILIETIQLFLWRSTDIDDVILNTFGTLAGYVVYVIFRWLAPALSERAGSQKGGVVLPWLLFGVGIVSMFGYGYYQMASWA